MKKLRILFALLSFGAGTASTVPFHNHKNLLDNYLSDRASQRIEQVPQSVPAFHGVMGLSPRIGSGFGGNGATISGSDESFTLTTGDDSSYDGKVFFGVVRNFMPACALHWLNIDYTVPVVAWRSTWTKTPLPLNDGMVITAEGSHFPPHTRIQVECRGVR